MNPPPGSAEFRDVRVKGNCDPSQLTLRKAFALPQTDRPFWAVKIEDCPRATADDVNVLRLVVVEVDDNAQVPNSQQGRHAERIA